MLAVGCKKEGTQSFTIPSESILINVNQAGDEGTTTFKSQNISAIEVSSTPTGWSIVNIDMYAKSITVKSPATFEEGEQRSGTISLNGYTPAGTKVGISLYVAILEKEDVDYTSSPANCYIANEGSTRYLFNAMIGGSSTPLDTEYIDIVWQTNKDLIKYIDMQDGVASFYIEQKRDDDGQLIDEIEPGNVLIGAYNAAGELIWTWHIWITNSNPTEQTIELNGSTLMNINLGADCNSSAESDSDKIGRSYGLYYQWGRRTPIVGPESWNFSLNADKVMYSTNNNQKKLKYKASNSETGNRAWALKNPSTIITGNKDNNYDWLYEGHEELWSAKSKSEHDPCPAGWRVPESSVYEGLTISALDDAKPWQEVQSMYGWTLVDELGNEFFFSAAGRRNYLDGHLDIVNDDENRPVPWAGYYWTASSNDEGLAYAMFFDLNTATRTWNGFESARAMQRANAMPIRCVREK